MILQRDVPVPVWGNAEDGTVITVSWNGQNLTNTAQNGAWKVTLPPMPASAEPRVMSIQATGQDEIRLDNIVVGDVWLASGQSNMTMRLSEVTGGPEAIAASNNPLIRHYTVPRPEDSANGKSPAWNEANPRTTPQQSAVGYFFVHELQQKLGIPVGLLHCSYGGTVTETWCGPDVMARPWPEWEAQQNRARDNPKIHDRNKIPSYLHERMLRTVMPFPVKGFLWYQGEGNAGRAREQTELFPAMVADWRKSWGNENLPFFFVQLARYEAADWHNFRCAQLDCWRKIPNSHMVVTIDLSKEPGNHPIHPKTKAPIGQRLALAARARVYGETDLVHSGPVVRAMSVENGSAVLSFDHRGSGLAALDGKPLRGFSLSADGQRFFPGSAKIVGDTVHVSSSDVPDPVAVRYGAEADMGKEKLDVNLGNKEMLPASPFTMRAPAARPNIVLFLADDLSQEDLGCYGHPTIQTPHIDALAGRGMRFDNAYLTTSSCSPSRCSIITGRYPHNTGAPELHVVLPEDQIRFPELLRQSGYHTVLSGKNHMFGDADRAFDEITRGGKPIGSLDWVRHVRERPRDKPFFFWFASDDAHRDWQVTGHAPTYKPEDVIIPPYLVDSPATREDLASYYHEISRFDHFIGLVVAELAKQGVLENTMIVVASDNGRPFPRAKSRLYDSGIKTPWIVFYPAIIQEPAASPSLVSAIDFSATCLELAGIQRPAAIQGRSFVPILKDPAATIRDMVYAEQNWHVFSNHSRMVRFGDYLYIKNNYAHKPNLCLEAYYDPAARDLWQAHAADQTTPAQQQIFAHPQPAEELFLVSKDLHQLNNLAAEPAHAAALDKARRLLATWTKQTGDTLPENPTPDRHPPPRILDGKIIPHGPATGAQNPHAEMPGASRHATSIDHPGPLRDDF